ncbi:Tpk1, partial [Symbiodinium microadriaticum]
MDSIDPTVAEYYRSQGVEITRMPDQDTNDLEKCLQCILAHPSVGECPQEWTVLVMDPFGGRLDQQMAAVNAAFTWLGIFHRFLLLGEGNLAQVIPAGQSKLHLTRGFDGPYCGLFPVGSCTATVTTSGLKWNLQSQELRMGSLVSSSNEIVYGTAHTRDGGAAEVTIYTSHPVLWTCQIPT